MTRPDISIIAAVTRDNALGHRGQLIHRISDDMRHFRRITMGHPIVMGRKTFQSFPNGPLPGRRNVVVSRDPAFRPAGADVYGSLGDALDSIPDGTEVMIIGGGQIYAQALPLATRLYLTQIDDTAPYADTRFPDIEAHQWETTDCGEWLTDPATGIRYRFICLTRK